MAPRVVSACAGRGGLRARPKHIHTQSPSDNAATSRDVGHAAGGRRSGRGQLAESLPVRRWRDECAAERMDPAEQQFYADAFGGSGYQSRSYTLVNFGGGAGWVVGARTLTLDLSLRNAFNRRYADYLSRIKTNAPDPGMGRSLIVRITTEF